MHLVFLIGGWWLLAVGTLLWGYASFCAGVSAGKRIGHREAAIVIGKLALPAAFRSGWEIGHRGEALPAWTDETPTGVN